MAPRTADNRRGPRLRAPFTLLYLRNVNTTAKVQSGDSTITRPVKLDGGSRSIAELVGELEESVDVGERRRDAE